MFHRVCTIGVVTFGVILSAAAAKAELPCNIVHIPNPEPAPTDLFGKSVAISGNVAVVGAHHDDPGGGTNTGSAYIYRYNGSAWLLEQTIPNPTPVPADWFGWSVAVSGDVVLIGAEGPEPGGGLGDGSVCVYRYDGSEWLLEQVIPNPETSNMWFARSLALSGDVAVVGAELFDAGGFSDSGAVYVYRYNGSSWLLDEKVLNPDPDTDDYFGRSVAVSGINMIIGASGDDIEGKVNVGSAYLYHYDGSTWLLEEEIHSPIPFKFDEFGWSVSISNDIAVVGAPGKKVGLASGAGSAYIYLRSGSDWVLQQTILNPAPAENDNFGNSVAVSGNVALVGAYSDIVAGFWFAGSAYVYRYNGSTWVLDQAIPNPEPWADDLFGHSVAVSGELAIIGASQDDFRNLQSVGSAYVFELQVTMADLNSDCAVNEADFTLWLACLQGPDTAVEGDCDSSDFSGDGDVDLEDYSVFQSAFAPVP